MIKPKVNSMVTSVELRNFLGKIPDNTLFVLKRYSRHFTYECEACHTAQEVREWLERTQESNLINLLSVIRAAKGIPLYHPRQRLHLSIKQRVLQEILSYFHSHSME